MLKCNRKILHSGKRLESNMLKCLYNDLYGIMGLFLLQTSQCTRTVDCIIFKNLHFPLEYSIQTMNMWHITYLLYPKNISYCTVNTMVYTISCFLLFPKMWPHRYVNAGFRHADAHTTRKSLSNFHTTHKRPGDLWKRRALWFSEKQMTNEKGFEGLKNKKC